MLWYCSFFILIYCFQQLCITNCIGFFSNVESSYVENCLAVIDLEEFALWRLCRLGRLDTSARRGTIWFPVPVIWNVRWVALDDCLEWLLWRMLLVNTAALFSFVRQVVSPVNAYQVLNPFYKFFIWRNLLIYVQTCTAYEARNNIILYYYNVCVSGLLHQMLEGCG